jgi:hypothetical protein
MSVADVKGSGVSFLRIVLFRRMEAVQRTDVGLYCSCRTFQVPHKHC